MYGTLDSDDDVRRVRLIVHQLTSGNFKGAGQDYLSFVQRLARFADVSYNGTLFAAK